MTSKDFTNWLRGYFSALGEVGPTMADVEKIKETLQLVKDPGTYFNYSSPITNLHPMPQPVEPMENPFSYPYAGTTVNYSSNYTEDKIEEKDEMDKTVDQ